MREQVILVDNNDIEIGEMSKSEAHQNGILHRAFSIFIFNSQGEMLLQQRAFEKYHSGGLWSNTCCSHPFPGEKIHDAAVRRLMEEMGLKATLNHIHSFTYKVQFADELWEHEFDHVFFGICDTKPNINTTEISNWKYVSIPDLLNDIKLNPDIYTEWFKICIDNVLDKYQLTWCNIGINRIANKGLDNPINNEIDL